MTQGKENTKAKLVPYAKAVQGNTSRVAADASSSWRDEIIRLLKDSLISELVYVLCCSKTARRHTTLSGNDSEFAFHTLQELAYASSLSRHIAQLEGEKTCSPSALRQLSSVVNETRLDLQPVIEANLTDEFVAILSYSRIIPLITEEDVETRRLLDEILNTEKEHAEQIKARLNNWGCK